MTNLLDKHESKYVKTQHLETWGGLGLLGVWGSEGEEFWLLGLGDYGLGQKYMAFRDLVKRKGLSWELE